jgi:uncharacterized sulfatase
MSKRRDDTGTRPNILLIVSDQHHPNLVGHTGETAVVTPALDRLAREGTVFERAYVSCPLCTPARASILSGQYPTRHGAWSIGTDVPEDVVSSARILGHDAGYATAIIGKSHFKSALREGSPEAPPRNQDWDHFRNWKGPWYGFDYAEVCNGHTNEPHAYSMHYGLFLHDSGIPKEPPYFAEMPKTEHGWDLPEQYHSSTWVSNRTIDFLERHSHSHTEQPFFLSVNFPDPHPPFRVPNSYLRRYQEAPVPEARRRSDEIQTNGTTLYRATVEKTLDELSWSSRQRLPCMHGMTPSEDTARRAEEVSAWRACMAMVELLDCNLGRILEALDKYGLAENTIVVFTSDHGDYMGNHWLWSKGGSHYDDAVRVPFVVRWPDRVRAGARCSRLQSQVDLAPTFLAAAGMDAHPQMQGRNQLPCWLTGSRAREGVWIDHRVEQGITVNTWITETHRLSLHAIHADQREETELYDLVADPTELSNIARESPRLVAALSAQLLRYISSVQGPWQHRKAFS